AGPAWAGDVPAAVTSFAAPVAARIEALDCARVSAADVRETLSFAPAPRILNLQGSLAPVTMEPLARFLIAMGYPADRLTNPPDDGLSLSSFADSAQLAGKMAWYYENEGSMPMLIGHSQGGMLAIRVLHEFAGAFHDSIEVWNPRTGESEQRTSIVDPQDGSERLVVGLKVPYAAALATGKLPRLLMGQWAMLDKLRAIPDTVDEFTGFTIEWDFIAGTFPGSEPYRATGSASVRNVVLPATTSHLALPQMQALPRSAAMRAWIDGYGPDTATPLPPADAGVDATNAVPAAELWYGVRKHWCREAQRQVRSQRINAAKNHG
ncbi:MAG TPA: hypothetical protein VIK97_07375, partial [Casimicrobiaceae bacterium]